MSLSGFLSTFLDLLWLQIPMATAPECPEQPDEMELVWVRWAPLWMPQHSNSSCSQWLMAKMFIQKVSSLILRQIFNIHHSVSAFSLDFYRTLLNTFPPPHLVLKISLQNVLILYQNRHQNRSFNDPPEGGFYYFLPAPKKKKKKNQT